MTDCNGLNIEPLIDFVDSTDTYMIRLRDGKDQDSVFMVSFTRPDLATSDPDTVFYTTFVDSVAVEIDVISQYGDTATYTLFPYYVDPSTVKKLVEFEFEAANNPQFNQTYVGTIDETAKTVTVHVPFGTEVDSLVASFMLEDEFATMTHSEEDSDKQVPQTSGESAIDYTTPAAFTVFAEDCSTVEYFVTVVIDDNMGNEIESLALTAYQWDNCEMCDNDSIPVHVMASFEDTTLTFTVPYGTDLSHVLIEGVLADTAATAVPAIDSVWMAYTGEFVVEVTAADGVAMQQYTVAIEMEDASDENMLLTYGFLMADNPSLEADVWGVIDEEKNRIDVQVPFATDTMLIATFTNSPFSCVYMNGPVVTEAVEQCSGVSENNYTTYLTYAVVSQSGMEEYYNVYVEYLPAEDEQWIKNFMVLDLEECFGEFVYDEEGMMSGTDITVYVKYGTDVTALEVDFEIPDKASVDSLPGVYDFTEPVTFTVTAQDGTSTAYTVTVVHRDQNSEKMIKSYEFKAADNGFDAVGTIDQTDKIIEVWVPWLTDVKSLVATFTLSDGAKMTHSEDDWILQESGVTPNDFTTPVAYTVWAEDCSTLEYFVIVNITPNTQTGISSFVFDVTGCYCDDEENVRIDEFAKRIHVRLPYADMYGQKISLSSIAPYSIGIADGASISPEAGKAQNFADGKVVEYTVTAPDGVSKAVWSVMVENPPCTETDILSWHFQGGVQVDWMDEDDHPITPVIDADNHTIHVLLVPGTDLTSLIADSELSCGATICCSFGNCAGVAMDFSGEGNCLTCVVTAQDKSITQDWTICVEVADVEIPEVMTTSVLAHNCADSVLVSSTEAGTIYLVDEATAMEINAYVNGWTTTIKTVEHMSDWLGMNEMLRGMLDDAEDHHMAASASYPQADTLIPIFTDGLMPGLYYAFSVDAAGNVSCASEEAVYIDPCIITVDDLCDLRGGSEAYIYVVSGEVMVSYEEDNFKFVQDADCGIKILDSKDALPAKYGIGTGLTNLKGTLDKSGNEYKFIPVCCYLPEKSSTGNVIEPVMLDWDEFVANCYDHERGYESMLVRITTPMIAFDDYGLGYTTWELDYLDLATVDARGNYEWFIQKVFNANYIGTEIPTEPTIYQGIRTNVNWWGNLYGLITPRYADLTEKTPTDIFKVTSGMLIADPDPVAINSVTPKTCESAMIRIINEGVGNLTITALYLDDLPGTDEFNIVDPVTVPFTLGTWEEFHVEVEFCPTDGGSESTVLLVEYGVGMVLEVPINGTTPMIFDFPYLQSFNCLDAPDNYFCSFGSIVNTERHGWSGNVNPRSAIGVYGGWGNAYEGNALNLRTRNYNPDGTWADTYAISPGVRIPADASDPVVEYLDIRWGNYTPDPKIFYISTDGLNWTEITRYSWNDMTGPEGYPAVDPSAYTKRIFSLAAYKGQTVYFQFRVTSPSNIYAYWVIDNFAVQERITTPILVANPNPADFGGVQVNETATQTISFANVGVSVAKIKKVELVQSDGYWSLADSNAYPVEIHDGDWAWAINGTNNMSVDVTYAPLDIGASTAQLKVTWGLYEDKVYYVDLMGEGLSCYTATEAFVGENWAASQNSWFKYTAEKFQIVYINSCHPNQDVNPDRYYGYDTWLYVYADCEGTLIAQNDDLEWDACPYNRASSGVTFAMNEGETVYIFWPWEFSSEHDDEGFYFNIEPSYPVDGDVCETAIPLTLPVVNHFGSTVNFADDYDMSPCSPYSNYMDGNDKVYSITLEYDGYLTGSILGAYGSIHVLDECPVEELEKRNCKAFASGPNGGDFEKRIAAGTYYVIISTWAPPQTVDYLLNMSFRGLGVDNDQLLSSMTVYPNPTEGRFTVSINNTEAMDMTLELVNISGQTVYRNEVKSVYSYTEEIDASAFARGVYYLKVNDGKEVKIEKIVVQ
jgi:hypothetical protein